MTPFIATTGLPLKAESSWHTCESWSVVGCISNAEAGSSIWLQTDRGLFSTSCPKCDGHAHATVILNPTSGATRYPGFGPHGCRFGSKNESSLLPKSQNMQRLDYTRLMHSVGQPCFLSSPLDPLVVIKYTRVYTCRLVEALAATVTFLFTNFLLKW